MRRLLGVLGCAAMVSIAAVAWTSPASASAFPPTWVGNFSTKANGKCLWASGWDNWNGIEMATCDFYSARQTWDAPENGLDPRGIQLYALRNGSTGMCIDAYPGPGAQLIQYMCDGSTDDQKWFLWFETGGRIFAESYRWPGHCMDASDWGRGRAVILYQCHWGDNQAWKIVLP